MVMAASRSGDFTPSKHELHINLKREYVAQNIKKAILQVNLLHYTLKLGRNFSFQSAEEKQEKIKQLEQH